MKNTILPVQPSLILRTDNYQRLDSDLDGISHFYRYCVKDGKGKEFHAVPDGSTDLLFEICEHGVNTYMGGTVLQVKEWEMEENCIYFGVRFLPGKALFPQGMTIGDVVDADVCVENQDLAGNLAEKIALEKDFQKQAAVFSDYYCRVRAKQTQKENSSVEIEKFIRRKMYETAGNISITELAKQSGYSACYIRRCFESVHGISPKVFGKFIRFQRMLHSIGENADQAQLEALAADCGYYDQSHMMKDFKKFSGMTPDGYRKELLTLKADAGKKLS